MCGTREVTVVESLVNRYLLWYLGYFGHLSIWFAVHFEQQEELFYSIDDTKSDARQGTVITYALLQLQNES